MAIQRIVKMTFRNEHCQDFETYFDAIKDQVGSQPGCHGVKLLKDQRGEGVYFTYSVWDHQDYLDNYRKTPLFGQVWPTVKNWFKEKPEAWSTEILMESKHG
jgi:quinol monooxygenase YgiN